MGLLNFETFWFVVIGVLWTGYFLLEGFDFGVGITLPFLGRDDTDRRVMINSIGPVWDGNEVWLITAGGAIFAAFPDWYATLFSGFYLALFLILVALIVRGVSFEYRNKSQNPRWRGAFDQMLFWGSAVPALLWGVAFANLLRGVPIDQDMEYVGTFFDLLNPYALFAGLATLGLFTLHGTVYLTLKTKGDLRERARRLALRLALPVAAVVIGLLVWTFVIADKPNTLPGLVPIAAGFAVLVVGWLVRERLEGWAFVATALAIVLVTANFFIELYPRVMVSSINPDFSLTVFNSSSANMSLKLMTVVAVVFMPIVLLYQGWTYYVFRARLSRDDFEVKSPIDLIASKLGGGDEQGTSTRGSSAGDARSSEEGAEEPE